MIKITPLRRTIRHLAQRLRMEGETFMFNLLNLRLFFTAKDSIILSFFVTVYTFRLSVVVRSQDSQDEWFTFGDSNCMFKMRCQRTISRNNRPIIWQNAGFMRSNDHHWFQGDSEAWTE